MFNDTIEIIKMSLTPFMKWKAQPVEFVDEDHGYSIVSDYYKEKTINGVKHYKITAKGIWKLCEGRLNPETHNFMVYLQGYGRLKKKTMHTSGIY